MRAALRFVGCATVLVAGCRLPFGEPKERAEIEKIIRETRAAADEHARKRAAALPQALDTLVPRPDLGPCPIKVAAAGAAAPAAGPAADKTVDLTLREWAVDKMKKRLVVRTPSEVATAPSPLIEGTRAELDSLANLISPGAGFANTLDWPAELAKARKLASAETWDYDVVVVEDERERPRLNAPEPGDKAFTFEAGRLRGRAFLYSYAEGKVLCAATVDATTSPDVGVSIALVEVGAEARLRMAMKLDDDLEANAMTAAANGMVLAGPKKE